MVLSNCRSTVTRASSFRSHGLAVLAEDTHPFQNPSLRMDNLFWYMGLTG